jgi:hypothetical protein
MSEFNFRQVTGSSKFRSWKEWKKGEFVILKIESFAPNKKNTKFLDITGKVLDHNFSQSDWQKNDRVSVNGTTGLQKFIDAELANLGEVDLKALVGKTCKIIFMGQDIVKTGAWAGSKTNVIEGYMADDSGAAAASRDVVAEANNLVEKSKRVL